MMRIVHLHGRLQKQFGQAHRFDVETAAEAMRALNCAFPKEFAAALSVGHYRIVRGDKRNGMRLDLDLVNSLRLGSADLHVIPAAAGAANGKGVAKTIVGAALVGGAIFFSGGTLAAPFAGLTGTTAAAMSWSSIATVGLGLALNGAATLLTKANSTSDAKRDESNTINSPGNAGRQGDAIPLIYGEVIVVPKTVSFDANIEDIGAYQGQTASMGDSVQAVQNGSGTPTFYQGDA